MAKMTFFEVIAKLKSNDPAFTKLNFQEIEFNVFDDRTHLNNPNLLLLAAAIKENQTIQRFEFEENFGRNNTDWNHVGIEAIGNALKDHPALEELHLELQYASSMTSAEMCGFLQVLSGKAKIKNLYLTLTTNLMDQVLPFLGTSIANNTTLESITIIPDSYYESEHKDDVLMTFAAGFAGKSLHHLNLNVRLNSASIEVLSQHLSMSNTLKTMVLNRCNITHASMTFITNILKKNPYLTDLNLSDNPLGSDGIKSLAGALPNLPKLKTLSLNNTSLDYKALDELADAWQKSNLKIRTLEIGMGKPYAFSDVYITVVKKIIENNRYLKNLTIKDFNFGKKHFYLLQDLLQNPSKCRLQKFIFGTYLQEDDDFNNALLNTLKSNPNLKMLAPPHELVSLTTAWRQNVAIQKKSQQLFIEKAIAFSDIYFAPSKDSKEPHFFSLLPREIFLLILWQLGRQEAFGMSDEDIIQCTRLIFENFSTRRKLMNENKYSPITKITSNSKLEVSKWWSLSSRENNPQEIFKPRTTEKEVKSSTKCNVM